MAMVYLTASVLAGTTTSVSVVGNLLLNAVVNQWAAFLFGGGGMAYGLLQHQLRRRTIKRMSDRITELEKKLDKKRSSSHLTKSGDTNPEDLP